MESVASHFKSEFDFGDRVLIDGCDSIKATVLAFNFRSTGSPLVDCAWFHNGEAKSAWIEEYRLTRLE